MRIAFYVLDVSFSKLIVGLRGQDCIILTSPRNAKLCDTGFSRILHADCEAMADSLLGLDERDLICAPELLATQILAETSEESDVWAFGMTVYVSVPLSLTPASIQTVQKECLYRRMSYRGLNRTQIMSTILRGKLPEFHSIHSRSFQEDDLIRQLRGICLLCWNPTLGERPRMKDVLAFDVFRSLSASLNHITSRVDGPTQIIRELESAVRRDFESLGELNVASTRHDAEQFQAATSFADKDARQMGVDSDTEGDSEEMQPDETVNAGFRPASFGGDTLPSTLDHETTESFRELVARWGRVLNKTSEHALQQVRRTATEHRGMNGCRRFHLSLVGRSNEDQAASLQASARRDGNSAGYSRRGPPSNFNPNSLRLPPAPIHDRSPLIRQDAPSGPFGPSMAYFRERPEAGMSRAPPQVSRQQVHPPLTGVRPPMVLNLHSHSPSTRPPDFRATTESRHSQPNISGGALTYDQLASRRSNADGNSFSSSTQGPIKQAYIPEINSSVRRPLRTHAPRV